MALERKRIELPSGRRTIRIGELCRTIATEEGLPVDHVKRAIQGLINNIIAETTDGNRIMLMHFGSFQRHNLKYGGSYLDFVNSTGLEHKRMENDITCAEQG